MIDDDFDIKKKVEDVLTETGFSEQRAAKMDVDDLLKYVQSTSSLPFTLTTSAPSPTRILDYCLHFTTSAFTSRNTDTSSHLFLPHPF